MLARVLSVWHSHMYLSSSIHFPCVFPFPKPLKLTSVKCMDRCEICGSAVYCWWLQWACASGGRGALYGRSLASTHVISRGEIDDVVFDYSMYDNYNKLFCYVPVSVLCDGRAFSFIFEYERFFFNAIKKIVSDRKLMQVIRIYNLIGIDIWYWKQ